MTFQVPDFNEYDGGTPPPDPEEPTGESEPTATGSGADPDEGRDLHADLDLGLDLTPEEQLTAEEVTARLRATLFPDEAPSGSGDPVDEAPVPSDQGVEESPDDLHSPAAPVSAQGPAAAPASAPAAGSAANPDLQAQLELVRLLSANPELAARLFPQQQGQQQPAAEPEPDPMPEWLDKDDPAQVHFWTQNQETKQRLDKFLAAQEQQTQEQQDFRNRQLAAQGLANFKAAHPELSDEDLDNVRLHAVSLNIVDAMVKGSGDVVGSVEKALDLAYKDKPEFQPSPTPPQPTEGEQRRQKLSSLSTSGGTASRRPPAPPKAKSDREMIQQVADYFAQQPGN